MQELCGLVDTLAPDDPLFSAVPDRNEIADDDWDDDDVNDACFYGGDVERGVRELVLFKTNELDKLLDTMLPPNHRLAFLWDSAGDDDPSDCYMRIAVRGAEVTAVRSLRGWKYADGWENAIRVFDVDAPAEVVAIAKAERVKLTTADAMPTLSVEEEAQARSDMAKVAKLFGLEAVGRPAWKVMVKHCGG